MSVTIAIAELLLRWTTIVFVFDALQTLYINLFRGIKVTVVLNRTGFSGGHFV